MQYFFVYYMNLMFSALSPEDQRVVIDKCLEPLLELAEKGYKLGIQISGVSLELINDYRPNLIIKIANLIRDKKIDFIGNGYAQIIQPLFPHELNLRNQKIGCDVYQKLINYTPDICTVNEMAYSRGSCESICEVGYSKILMEWNNPQSIMSSSFPNQFAPAKTLIADKEVDVLWCDTVAFQKFQKYVHGEMSIDQYLTWLKDYTNGYKGNLCLYCSDAEIFGFRPKRYGTEITPSLNEWKRLEILMKLLQSMTIFPKEVSNVDSNLVQLTNAEYPVIVKKQLKYNINRWAITGRNDQKINTFCYRVLDEVNEKGINFSNNDWKDLLKLASSDLRTHIEDTRWNNSKEIIKNFEQRFNFDVTDFNRGDFLHIPTSCLLLTDHKRGNNITCWPTKDPVFGKVDLGNFSKVNLMADFYSGFVVIEKLGYKKVSDLDYEASSFNQKNYNEFSTQSGYKIVKYVLEANARVLKMLVRVIVPARAREQIKILNFSLSSKDWDVESIYYKSNLGGVNPERFEFGRKSFNQDDILNLNVVGVNGFSSTDNVLTIGDDHKEICFRSDSSYCFSLVRLTYEVEDSGKFLLQIAFVVQDIDETFREDTNPQEFYFPITIDKRIKSAK